MRVSICVGNYAKTPYRIPGLEIELYCLEELCYCVKENAFLLDLSFLDDGLLGWIEKECGLREFARALHPLVHKQGSLSTFVAAIMRYVGLYDGDTVRETEQALKQGAGLSSMERRKNQVDSMVRKKKYKAALKGYDELLGNWQDTEAEGGVPAAGFLAAVWHNKGVAYAGLMLYDSASECFRQAYELGGGEESRLDYLAANRLRLSQEEYVAFVSQNGEVYGGTLELERKLEQITREWECQPDYLRLNKRRELRRGGDGRKVYEENVCVVQALKESYRKL